MRKIEEEIKNAQSIEKRQKEEELKRAKESEHLIGQLEIDLEKILDEKKAQIKVCEYKLSTIKFQTRKYCTHINQNTAC